MEELVVNKQQVCGRHVLVVYLTLFWCGQVYLVAGDDAHSVPTATFRRLQHSFSTRTFALQAASFHARAARALTFGSLPSCAAYSVQFHIVPVMAMLVM